MLMWESPLTRYPSPSSNNVFHLSVSSRNQVIGNFLLLTILHCNIVRSGVIPTKIDHSVEQPYEPNSNNPLDHAEAHADQILSQMFPSLSKSNFLKFNDGQLNESVDPLGKLFQESSRPINNQSSSPASYNTNNEGAGVNFQDESNNNNKGRKSQQAKISVFDLNTDANTRTNEDSSSQIDQLDSTNSDEDFKYFLNILLAQQEARCLQDFGATQQPSNYALDDDLFRPFSCPPDLSFDNACDQCRNLTKALPRSEDCQILCEGSLWKCMDRCNTIVRNISSDLKTYKLFKTVPVLGENFNIKTIHCKTKLSDEECLSSLEPRRRIQSPTTNTNSFVSPLSNPNARATKSANHSRTSNFDNNFINSVQVFCEGVTPALAESSVDNMQNAQRHRPHKTFNRHFILLKTRFTTAPANGRIPSINYTNEQDGEEEYEEERILEEKIQVKIPIVFVVEQREGLLFADGAKSSSDFIESRPPSWSTWKTLGKTPVGFDEIPVAYLGRTYQWRVTAVSSHGIVDRMSTDHFNTLNGYVEPGQPKRIYVIDTRVVHDTSLDVLIGWDPPDERACFYKIVLDNQDVEEKPRTVRIRDEPLGVHRYWFENLKFGTNYGVIITSRSAGWHENESTHNKLHFVTPTCLQVHQFRFDKCEPPPPRNLSSTLTAEGPDQNDEASKKMLTSTFTLILNWLPPPHANDVNVIQNYIVEITLFPLHVLSPNPNTENWPGMNSPDMETIGPFHLQGNVTQIQINGLLQDREYQVSVVAVSEKGPSPPARMTVSTKQEIHPDTVPSNWIYLSIPIAAVLAFGLTCHFTRNFLHKRKIKAARNSYFKSMEERDAMTNEWSIVPLNEEYSPFKLLDENFPKEKWDIGFENLTMGDIIGQGAFGVVRRAQMPRKKYIELQHKYKKLGAHLLTTKLEDEDAYQTVAVKMLKVAATKSDRDELIKEIVTMQNLGSHPQIVSLLGACTQGRSVCLVLEYCPGGDLLSFLRKVREQYWPMLNLGTGGNSKGSPNRNQTSCSRSHQSSSDGTKKSESYESSQISYADIGIFSEYSSASYTGNPEDTSTHGRNETGYSTTEEGVNNNEEAGKSPKGDGTESPCSCTSLSGNSCRPICEKDILSYARQISLGMEYLERNHVVHRDLACRNVLVMGDYKQVKISDFGLSRDIYTWNVYHQKTDGKLPVKWMAIESIFTHMFTSKSDVWSYGILLWELVTSGGNPYPAIRNNELFHLLKTGYRMERPENCSEELYALMRKCWRTAPADRPNFTELRRHLETMMEASEPTLYLSLQSDIPSDYFNINERSEILLRPVSLNYPSLSFGDSKLNRGIDKRKNNIANLPLEEIHANEEMPLKSPSIEKQNDYYNFRLPSLSVMKPRDRICSDRSSVSCAGTELTELSTSNPISPASITSTDEVFQDGFTFPDPITTTQLGATNSTQIFRRPTEAPISSSQFECDSKYPHSTRHVGSPRRNAQQLKQSIVLSVSHLLSSIRFPSLIHSHSSGFTRRRRDDMEKVPQSGRVISQVGNSRGNFSFGEDKRLMRRTNNTNCDFVEEDEIEEAWNKNDAPDLSQRHLSFDDPLETCASNGTTFPTLAINRAYGFNFKL